MTTDQTTQPLDLDAVRARVAHVIAGPWTVGKPRCVDEVDAWEIPIHLPSLADGTPDERSEFAVVRYQTAGFQYPHGEALADAEFIAHARQDVLDLLAEVEQLRDLRDAAIAWRKAANDATGDAQPEVWGVREDLALIEAVDKLTEEGAR